MQQLHSARWPAAPFVCPAANRSRATATARAGRHGVPVMMSGLGDIITALPSLMTLVSWALKFGGSALFSCAGKYANNDPFQCLTRAERSLLPETRMLPSYARSWIRARGP